MHNTANLLVDYWSEYYKAAGYLFNYISIKWFNWKILFEITDNIKSDFNYMYVYGVKVYILRNKILYKDWFKSRAYINFLVGYDSCNIYYIWFPSSKCVMHIRDIIFIKNKFYKSDKLDLGFIKNIKKIIKYFKILLSRPVPKQKKLVFNKKKLSYIYNQFYIII